MSIFLLATWGGLLVVSLVAAVSLLKKLDLY